MSVDKSRIALLNERDGVRNSQSNVCGITEQGNPFFTQRLDTVPSQMKVYQYKRCALGVTETRMRYRVSVITVERVVTINEHEEGGMADRPT
jgi:hypothetical protein